MSTSTRRWYGLFLIFILKHLNLHANNIYPIIAIADLTQILYLKSKQPTGQDLVRHQQVLQFLNFQVVFPGRSRKELAIEISVSARREQKVAERIIRHEKEWICKWCIPARFQGETSKVMSMFEDKVHY